MIPAIFDYLDYRIFLKDYYQVRKSESRHFSFQKLAWKAGFRSKSFFNEVISGKKNLAPGSLYSIAQALDLRGDSQAYFEALVTYNQAKNGAEKSHAFSRLLKFQNRTKAKQLAKDQYAFYSKWYHNTLRECVTLFDFKEDYALLGRMLKPAITAAQAKASVALLLRLGLLICEQGRYRQSDPSITSGDEVLSKAITQFHLKNMQLAAASIENVDSADRDISCLIVGLSPKGFLQLKTEIQDFRKRLVHLIRNDSDASRVYHINFQFFPTSESTHE